LAWLGGGSVAASGGGMVAGKALLALAGPVGWTIAGATLLSSIIVFSTKKTKLNKQKNEEILALKENIEAVVEMSDSINGILIETKALRDNLNRMFTETLKIYGADYLSLEDEQKKMLGALVNNTKALSAMFDKTIGNE